MNRVIVVVVGLFAVQCFPVSSFPQSSTAKSEAIARAGVNGVSVPQCVFCPAPDYTDKARKAGFEGTVVLRIIVTADGRAQDVKVTRGTGKDLGLEEKAVEVVKKWRFKPADGPDGKPIAVLVPVQVGFRLYRQEK